MTSTGAQIAEPVTRQVASLISVQSARHRALDALLDGDRERAKTCLLFLNEDQRQDLAFAGIMLEHLCLEVWQDGQ